MIIDIAEQDQWDSVAPRGDSGGKGGRRRRTSTICVDFMRRGMVLAFLLLQGAVQAGAAAMSKKRARELKVPGDADNWVDADDYRMDLSGKLAFLGSWFLFQARYFAREFQLLTLMCVPLLIAGCLSYSHRYGPHCDVPFTQYLRFQARVKTKGFLRFLQRFLATLARLWQGGILLIKLLHNFIQQRSWKHMLISGGVVGLWLLSIRVGCGAVYILVLGFVLVASNLGQRSEGEASAYPVFNNYQPLQGELRMDQVEAEMRGMGHLHAMGAANRMRPPGALPGRGSEPMESTALVGLERNAKVEIEKDGRVKSIKGKVLQEHLDRGWRQVELGVRYAGIRYHRKVGARAGSRGASELNIDDGSGSDTDS